ncbi:uncharacterized protein JN550_009702 [Neoarthrinium moseri]|uniref:uncharacterized protein n=1 Tax=Neoarthrinium moseri TaxID=1658444 RepID=UPI001FDDE893|nr:uncharacterized protein JN550_009702 [Neoarthrinium moseri]KAI1863176.1 hypothetical protein JN550_009702 [Neoarthrinium moseri]
MPNIVVAGAGVSGLTTAYVLSQQKRNVVTVVAKHMPGDYDIEYASPVAGANVLPMSTLENSRWERETWPILKKIAVQTPEAGVHLQKSRVFRRQKDIDKLKSPGATFDGLFAENPWYSTLFEDFRELPKEELPEGMASGCEFGSVCINVMVYLPWLLGQCRKNGVLFKRASLKHLLDVTSLTPRPGKVDIIVNATGLGSLKLGGVTDKDMTPIRGQVVVVRNESPHMFTMSGTDDEADEVCYAMTRAAGGGTVLGGTYMKGSWESQPDPNQAMRIMRRACQMVPELTNGQGVRGLDIVRHGVGLRPHRNGGVRVEKEKMGDIWVVHNYGHSSWGYQGSWGCAAGVLELVNEVYDRAKL